MPVCMALVELAITCVHDYMVVTVTVAKIYGKMNYNRWALAITAVPTTLTSRFLTTGCTRVLKFICIRRELGGTGTGCLFQFTYCETCFVKLLADFQQKIRFTIVEKRSIQNIL